MSNVVIMETLSKTYGWTPNQIREISRTDIMNYLQIIKMKNHLEKEEYKKMSSKIKKR